VSDAETNERLKGLLDRLEAVRGRLEEAESSEQAVDLLQELADLAKETQAEIERARRSDEPGADRA
jgi:nitrate reductase assembly molybdenum cofactor insertion protein NarJ